LGTEQEDLLNISMYNDSSDQITSAPMLYVVENCITYMAGWVVKSISPNVSCDECR